MELRAAHREEAAPLSLTEVAEVLAQHMNCQVQPSDDPFQVRVNGSGYHFIVAPFFGGWQVALHLPGKPPINYYGEAVQMLESRLKAKLSGRDPED